MIYNVDEPAKSSEQSGETNTAAPASENSLPPIPDPGYTILHLRALQDGIAPHGVAFAVGLRDAHYYAIECGYHPGDPVIWSNLANYFGESEEVLREAAFRQHRLERFLSRQRRHNLLTFHLLGGYTITGTFESSDEGSIKLIELENQRKVMINRLAVVAWRFLGTGSEDAAQNARQVAQAQASAYQQPDVQKNGRNEQTAQGHE